MEKLFLAVDRGSQREALAALSELGKITKDIQDMCLAATVKAISRGSLSIVQTILTCKAFRRQHRVYLLQELPNLLYIVACSTDVCTKAESAMNLIVSSICSAPSRIDALKILDLDGFSALHLAAMDGNRKAARILLLLGADGKQKSRDGNTALTFSIAFNHEKFSELILPYSDINSRDEDHDTALMFAAWRDQDALISKMIVQGADVNSRSRHGSTALWNAVYRSSRDSVLVLLKNNADMGIRCEGTHLFLTETASTAEGEIKKIYPGHKRSLLWVAVEMAMNVQTRSKSLAIISLLLQAGYDVNGDHWIKRISDHSVSSDPSVSSSDPSVSSSDPSVSSSQVPMRFRDDNALARLLLYFYTRPLQLRDICRNKLRKLHQRNASQHCMPLAQWVSEAGLGGYVRDFVCLLYLDKT